MSRCSLLLYACLVAACGGAPAKSAADADAEAEAEADADTDTTAASDGASESPEGPAPARAEPDSAATPASKEDVQAVLQLVIDDEELTPYLHLERSDRFPIRIAGELPPDLALTKATQPVQVVDAAEAKGKPVIVFTEISVAGENASVRYRYDVEGVRGSATLSKRDGRWVLARSRVTARSAN